MRIKYLKNVKFDKRFSHIEYILLSFLINNFENCRIFAKWDSVQKIDADPMTFARIRAGGRFRFRAIMSQQQGDGSSRRPGVVLSKDNDSVYRNMRG